MKTLKLEKGATKSKVNRQLLSRFGQALYIDPNVNGVFMRVGFKDGSSISFRRDEEEDEIEGWRGDDEDEE